MTSQLKTFPAGRKILGARAAVLFGAFVLAIAMIVNAGAPLQGLHSIRQADTLFAGWSYCTEGAEFLRPRVAHRGTGTGVNIGEFPLASAVFAAPCLITGHWSEGAVKAVTLLILILNAGLWGLLIRRRWPARWPGWDWFALIWVFNTHALLHFTIALPDALALTLIAAAGLTYRRGWRAVAAVALFTIAFGMRPYFIPLVFAAFPGWIAPGAAVAACAVFYAVWFKWWILQSEFSYYATGLTSPAEAWAERGPVLGALAEAILRNGLNLIGAWWVARALRDGEKTWALLFAGSVAMVLAARAPMIVHHEYYLGAAFVFLTLLMLKGARGAAGWQAWVFLLIGIANVQHQWHAQAAATERRVLAELARQDVPPADKIAVYIGEGSAPTNYLYWAKHTGWALPADQFPGLDRCPRGAAWAMVWSPEGPRIDRCTGETP